MLRLWRDRLLAGLAPAARTLARVVWRDRLLVGFAPTELALARVSGGLRQRIGAKHVVPCAAVSAPEPWQGPIAALKTAIESARGDALDVTVVLSNHFVRYAIVPWDDALASAEEELAFARHCFTKTYGERARTWLLRVSEERAGAPRLASAIDAALLDAVNGCFPRNGKARLASVQPYLMAAFNGCRSSMPPAGAWLMIVEAGRACLALHAQGQWQAVQNTKGEFAAPDGWATLLERERHRTGNEAADTVVVHTARGAAANWPRSTNWKFQSAVLPARDGYSPLEDGRYVMALSAG
ncbi:MAG: hypothetical protein ACREVR_07755 [Burkholderiales bacterium]